MSIKLRDAQQPLWKLLSVLYKPHPWHGISPGEHAPAVVQCFVEVVPTDTVKYEIDKISGYLCVDRPQKYSNVCPALYGFIPQTYCGDSVAAFSGEKLAGHSRVMAIRSMFVFLPTAASSTET